MAVFENAFAVNAPLDEVWNFHDDPSALTRVMKGPIRLSIHHVDRPVQPGSKIAMTLWVGFIPIRWNVKVISRTPPNSFIDQQIGVSIFAQWKHTHRFEIIDKDRTWVMDRIEYEPPLGNLGRWLDRRFGQSTMKMLFARREQATKRILEASEQLDTS